MTDHEPLTDEEPESESTSWIPVVIHTCTTFVQIMGTTTLMNLLVVGPLSRRLAVYFTLNALIFMVRLEHFIGDDPRWRK